MEIQMRGIEKSFGHNTVLEGVNLHLKEGEVHALVGENGAGKSTLMNILTGLHTKDSGQIIIDGVEHHFTSPKEAEEHGIFFIHQEMLTWPDMTVLDNLFMNKQETNALGIVQTKVMKKKAEEIFSRLGVEINVDQPMRNLSVGQQQLVEIAKSLIDKTHVIIMDEPTASLTDNETAKLFQIMEELKKDKVTIVYISHRMEELFSQTDRMTIMRDGVSVLTEETANLTEDIVVANMVGRDLDSYYPDKTVKKGEVVFEVKDLCSEGKFNNVSFHVREGEILGVAGLMGSGRTEIMRAIFGMDPIDSGEMTYKGKTYAPKEPRDAIARGIGFVTENRKEEGLVLNFSVRDNVSMPIVETFNKAGVVDEKQENDFVNLLVERLKIKISGLDQAANDLSGGNQQKVVIAKWIGAGSQLLILDEPTRGVDVGAKSEIYNLMKELTDRHVAIIMVSSDLPEVIGVSDRVMVVSGGEVAGEVSHDELSEERIMTIATGGL